MDTIIIFIIAIAIAVGLFFLLRNINLWYFRINDGIERMDKQIELLEQIKNHLLNVPGNVKELPKTENIETLKEEPVIRIITYTKHTYKCDAGELIIEQEYQNPNNGEAAYLNGKPAPTGKYKIGFLQTISILDGKVNN